MRYTQASAFLGAVLLTLSLTENAWAPIRADEALGILGGLQQLETLESLNSQFKGQELVRPSGEERKAIDKLLKQKPSPESLDEADAKFLKAVRGEAAWTKTQRETVRMILKEVGGIDFTAEDQTAPKP